MFAQLIWFRVLSAVKKTKFNPPKECIIIQIRTVNEVKMGVVVFDNVKSEMSLDTALEISKMFSKSLNQDITDVYISKKLILVKNGDKEIFKTS